MADDAARGTFEDVVRPFDPEVRAIARALRARISSAHVDFVELAWPRLKIASYGVGPKKMSEHYAYIAPFRTYVNLGFYHGVALDDPAGLLEGTGRRLRHVRIRSLADVGTEGLRGLLEAALLDRKAAVVGSSSSAPPTGSDGSGSSPDRAGRNSTRALEVPPGGLQGGSTARLSGCC